MKKFSYLVLIFLSAFSIKNSWGQAGMWTWMNGNDTIHSTAHFGTQGVPDVLNTPPCLYEPAEWKETQGYFWMFGGFHFAPAIDSLRDDNNNLWRFNPITNEWTWMKGPGRGLDYGSYGIKGVSSPLNLPACRAWGTPTWVDNNNNLWIYSGSIRWSDLWKYEIATNEWTWMQGDTTAFHYQPVPANYGTFRIPSPTNSPGTRVELNATWTDDDNNLWLFGGVSYDSAWNGGVYSDLWKFNISTNEWTWMDGPNTPDDHYGNYGILGVPSAANHPPARGSYAKWKDPDGNFYLLGGGDFTFPNQNFTRNDIWKYDWRLQMWTWLGGDTVFTQGGHYSAECVTDSLNSPRSFYEDRATVYDSCGNVFHFGGCTSGINQLPTNELWHYSSCLNKWTLLKADSPANWGTKGVSSTTNRPPAKFGSIAWLHNKEFWVFAGSEYGNPDSYNDVWKFDLDSLCYPDACQCHPTAGIVASQINLCPGTCTDFTSVSSFATTYQWLFPGGFPSSSNSINPNNICYTTPGTYDVILIASNSNGSDTLTLPNYITVFPQPPAQSIIQSDDTLFAIAGSSSYQWYYNGNIIVGATDYFYVATASGDYNVVATDENNCEVEAVINNVIAAVGSGSRQVIQIFPNPVTETIDIRGLENNSADEIKIFNIFGENVFTAVDWKLGTVNCKLFSSGLYYIEITSDKKTYRAKFVKQ